MMLEAGWPVDARGDKGQTPLHWAGFHGNVEMVRALLRHKAPLEAQEWQFKGTPMGWALYGSEHGWHRETGDYPGTVLALLAAGAKAPQDIDRVEAPRRYWRCCVYGRAEARPLQGRYFSASLFVADGGYGFWSEAVAELLEVEAGGLDVFAFGLDHSAFEKRIVVRLAGGGH